MRTTTFLSPALVAMICSSMLLACNPAEVSDTDAQATLTDSAVLDTVVNDAGVLDVVGDDSNTTDASQTTVPLNGFGSIAGTCGVLDDELTSAQGVILRNSIDFGTDPYDEVDYTLLSVGGQEIIDDGNAGGSSLYSEVFAYEVLYRCELATLLKTETEIIYQGTGKITDFLVQIDGLKIGVSVTRAIAYPFDNPYTVEQAQTLLEDKLQDVLASSAHVSSEDAWVKQILHVIAYTPAHADSLLAAYELIDTSISADTIVFVTVSNGDDGFIY